MSYIELNGERPVQGALTVKRPGRLSQALHRLGDQLPRGYVQDVVRDVAYLAPSAKKRPEPQRTILINRR